MLKQLEYGVLHSQLDGRLIGVDLHEMAFPNRGPKSAVFAFNIQKFRHCTDLP